MVPSPGAFKLPFTACQGSAFFLKATSESHTHGVLSLTLWLSLSLFSGPAEMLQPREAFLNTVLKIGTSSLPLALPLSLPCFIFPVTLI